MSHDIVIRVPAYESLQPPPTVVRRCAIYARVSVSSNAAGLSSLQAQVQACEAYIQAQRAMGWELVAPAYVDDGFSGRNLERPALRQLMQDLQSDKFDAVVVQRLDRLCRSVRDICDLLPTFSITHTALVSTTQALDSETPVGRLTLHLLTTFSEFEREMVGERIRDKFAITRASGKWQRNGIPLGYVLNDQQELQIDNKEAAVARDIFERFLNSVSMPTLIEELNALGYRTKAHVSRNGNLHGGKPFDRNTLNQLLRNRAYIGEVFFQNEWHPGQHEPIVSRDLWDRVQSIRSKRARRSGVPNSTIDLVGFPLGGRVYWHDGRAYTVFASSLRKGRRYCYYKAPPRSDDNATTPVTISTANMHMLVIDYLRACFKDPQPWLDDLSDEWRCRPEFEPTHVKSSLQKMDSVWHLFLEPLVAEWIIQLVDRVVVYPNQVQIVLSVGGLSELLQVLKSDTVSPQKAPRKATKTPK
jgi:DNA invertase Pin-like site-specific DNA recombinase